MPSETNLTPQEALRVLDTHHESLGFHRPTQCKFAQALAVLRAAVEWRPIESAPKDGREVLLLLEWRYPGITKAPQYRYGVGQWRNGNWRHMQAGVPIAWMPLPQPPPEINLEVRDADC
jgi:hypothetical protein